MFSRIFYEFISIKILTLVVLRCFSVVELYGIDMSVSANSCELELLVLLWDGIMPFSPGWSQVFIPPALASQVLGIQTWTSTSLPGSNIVFNCLEDTWSRSWRNGSVAKSAYYHCRGPSFSSQYPYGSSQLKFQEIWYLFWPPQALWCICICPGT